MENIPCSFHFDMLLHEVDRLLNEKPEARERLHRDLRAFQVRGDIRRCLVNPERGRRHINEALSHLEKKSLSTRERHAVARAAAQLLADFALDD